MLSIKNTTIHEAITTIYLLPIKMPIWTQKSYIIYDLQIIEVNLDHVHIVEEKRHIHIFMGTY